MRLRGINYDTGFARFGDALTRANFDPSEVRREMAIIAQDLHCTAVRITGRDAERIALAAEAALGVGLEVWFSPFPTQLGPEELLPYFVSAARAAQALRDGAGHVVFVLGGELTVFNRGFLPGADYADRLGALSDPARLAAESLTPEELVQRFQAFLATAVSAVRAVFGGPVSYASGLWEPVDWTPFDIIGVDHYRDASNRETYGAELRPYFTHERPVVVTEFGCCTYRGAQDRGAMGWDIVDRSARPARLKEQVVRDEQVQAEYLKDLLQILDQERVAGAFWFTFAGFLNPYRADPALDLDCASYGLVKVLEGSSGSSYSGLPWEPKRAFHALAGAYQQR